MEQQIKKIVVIGPESTGKSSLCKGLAAHYNTVWVQEYAREYLTTFGTNYGFADLEKIALGQLKKEDESTEILKVSGKQGVVPLIIDTDMHVIKVWSEFVFNKCTNTILDFIATRKYDLYLLANIDLPWAKDEMREYPDYETREKLFHHYKDLLVFQQTPWAIVCGIGQERLNNAIKAVDQVLKKH